MAMEPVEANNQVKASSRESAPQQEQRAGRENTCAYAHVCEQYDLPAYEDRHETHSYLVWRFIGTMIAWLILGKAVSGDTFFVACFLFAYPILLDCIKFKPANKLAESCQKNLIKGRMVLIKGSLVNDNYKDDQGTKHRKTITKAVTVEFLDSRKNSLSQSAASQVATNQAVNTPYITSDKYKTNVLPSKFKACKRFSANSSAAFWNGGRVSMLEIILTRIKARVKMNMEGDNHERIFFQGDTQNLEKRWMARGCLCRRSSSIQAPDKERTCYRPTSSKGFESGRLEEYRKAIGTYI